MADNNLAEKLAAMTCEGCAKGLPTGQVIPSAMTYHTTGPTGFPCTSKAPELLTLMAEVEAAAYGRAAQEASVELRKTLIYIFEKHGISPALEEVWPHGDSIRDKIAALAPVGLAEHDRKLRLEEADWHFSRLTHVCAQTDPVVKEAEIANFFADSLQRITAIRRAALRREEPR